MQHSDAASKCKHTPSVNSEPPPPPPSALPPEDRESGREASLASSVVGDASQPQASPGTAKVEAPTAIAPPSEGDAQEEQEGCGKECRPAVLVHPQGEEGVTITTSEAVLSTSDSTAYLEEGKTPKAAQDQAPSPSPSPSLSPDISIEPVSTMYHVSEASYAWDTCSCEWHVYVRCMCCLGLLLLQATASLKAYSELVIAVRFSPALLGEHAASFAVEFSRDEVDKVYRLHTHNTQYRPMHV